MRTLLGGDVGPALTEQEWAAEAERLELATQAEESARLVLGFLLSGYKRGELGFEDFCRRAHQALAPEHVPQHLRRMWLGDVVSAAIAAAPLPRPAGQTRRPDWLCELSHDLCNIVRERERLPLTRRTKLGGQTAFERVAEILKLRGISATDVTVSKARADWKKYTASR